MHDRRQATGFMARFAANLRSAIIARRQRFKDGVFFGSGARDAVEAPVPRKDGLQSITANGGHT